MSSEEVLERFLPSLMETAAKIGQALSLN
jgi:hypothetical protein